MRLGLGIPLWSTPLLGAPSLSLTPGSASLNTGDSQTFTAHGGTAPYTYSLSTNVSGGAINSSTGAYYAGPKGGTDVVTVTDHVGATATSNITVTGMSGMSLWLRPDLGVTLNSGNVATWADQSGNGNNASALTVGEQPPFTSSNPSLGNLPTIRLGNSKGMVIAGASDLHPTAGITVLAVTAGVAPNYGQSFTGFIMCQQAGAWSDGWGFGNLPSGTAGQVGFYSVAYTADYSYFSHLDTTWRQYIGTYNSTAAHLYQNGSNTGATETASGGAIVYNANNQVALGGYTTAGGTGTLTYTANPFDCAEFIILDHAASSTELTRLHNYSLARYGF